MLRVLAAIILLVIGFGSSVDADDTCCGRTVTRTNEIGNGCTQSANFLARTSGISITEENAYILLICGLASDGIINGQLFGAAGCGGVLDALYIFATSNTLTANLNLCGTKYPLVPVQGMPTFTSGVGYTPNNGCLTTNFVPLIAGGNMALNSAHWGIYILTNRTTPELTAVLGASDTSSETLQFFPLYSGGMDISVNAGPSGDTIANPVSTTQGSWIGSRTSPSLTTIYRNGSSLTTTTTASVGLPYEDLYILGRDFLNACNAPDTVQVSAAWFGGGLTETQAIQIQARINAYMTALGINVY